MDQAETIRAFVQDVLGCHCPAEVFAHVELESVPAPPGARALRIDIGARLRVELCTPLSAAHAGDWAARRVRAGIAARDAAGMNRYRLVLGCADADARAAACDAFDTAARGDPRAHLHCLAAADLIRFADTITASA